IWVREVANHALALLLAWNRKIVTLDRQVRAGVWSGAVPGDRTGALHGETVGIVGLGNIGSAFARRVAALETKVIACDPYVDDGHFAALGVERVSLETLAERSDYVSVHTLLNAETRHLIGETFFKRMKPTAIVINTSRGPVVDEQALARALQERRLAGAALDVWEQEPVAADNPLLRMDNVIATPHAAYFSTAAAAAVPRRCGEEVARACECDAGGYVHWGATTQNVTQTGQLLQVRRAHEIFLRQLATILIALADLAERTKDALLPGRTHGQHAVPATFGFKVAVWIDELCRHVERLRGAEGRVFVAMLGGGAGTLASLGEAG